MSDSSYKERVISFRISLIVATFLILGYLAVTVLLSNQQELRTIIIDIYNEIFQLLATFSLFYGAYHSKGYGKRVQTAWIVLALAQLSFAIGDIGFAYYDIYHGEVPYPSLADPPALIFPM